MTDKTRQEARRVFLVDTLKKLLGQDSPTGFTDKVVTVAEGIARELGFATRRTNKGNLVITVPGREAGRKVGLCAHVDTLGLMVRSITAESMLMVTKVGGPLLPTLDGEYCRIYTRDGQVYTGTVLRLSPSVHVQDDAATRPRDEKNMAVRIDEKVHSKEDVQALGIAAGDYVCYDPKTTVTDSGFVKSRFLDDKASASCLLTLLCQMHKTGTRPRYESYFTLTVHEEVGHGGATLPAVDELLAVDMGCIGEDLSCTEYQVSICAKDSGGPYDYGMVSRLVQLAKDYGVGHLRPKNRGRKILFHPGAAQVAQGFFPPGGGGQHRRNPLCLQPGQQGLQPRLYRDAVLFDPGIGILEPLRAGRVVQITGNGGVEERPALGDPGAAHGDQQGFRHGNPQVPGGGLPPVPADALGVEHQAVHIKQYTLDHITFAGRIPTLPQ